MNLTVNTTHLLHITVIIIVSAADSSLSAVGEYNRGRVWECMQSGKWGVDGMASTSIQFYPQFIHSSPHSVTVVVLVVWMTWQGILLLLLLLLLTVVSVIMISISFDHFKLNFHSSITFGWQSTREGSLDGYKQGRKCTLSGVVVDGPFNSLSWHHTITVCLTDGTEWKWMLRGAFKCIIILLSSWICAYNYYLQSSSVHLFISLPLTLSLCVGKCLVTAYCVMENQLPVVTLT